MIYQTANIAASEKQYFQILQISDPHIYANPAGRLLGVNTRQSLQAVLEDCRSQNLNPDIILITGDVSQDLSADSYRYLSEQLKQFEIPVFWLAGNHDEQALLDEHFNGHHIYAEKRVRFGNWQLLLLNSHIPGKVHGSITAEELSDLQTQLSETDELNTLVALHHHPIPVGCEWLDNLGVQNGKELCDTLDEFPKVRGIVCGHVHQSYQAKKGDITFMTSPSTCVQFKPNSNEFAASDDKPGYRVINCYESGAMESRVFRAEQYQVAVDHSQVGY